MEIFTKEPTEFELSVAQTYRDLGAKVEHNKNIGGLQIDVFVVQNTPDGATIRTAVECKAYSKALNLNDAVDICKRLTNLRTAGLIEKGVVIAYSGFTQDARTHFQSLLVECFTPADLQKKVADFTAYLGEIIEGHQAPDEYLEIIQKGAFIPLPARHENDQSITSIIDFIEGWLIGAGQLLTVLGEYGSGKTTTCWHIAQKLASIYLRTGQGRIPIIIELKRFTKNFSLRSFLTDFLLNQKETNLRSYSTFEKLNREGRLLIILDGFDEMTPHVDPAIVFKNLDDILSLTQNKSKVLLTCRTSFFKDQADLERLTTGRDLHSLLHKHKSYQIVFLQGFTSEQQQQYLSCYYKESWVEFSQQLDRIPRVSALAARPILLNMIVNTISSVSSLANMNITQLYERYTDIWIKRDNWRCHLTPDQRNNISKFLAFELVRENVSSIHHRELQRRLESYFTAVITPDMLDQYAHEVRTCTFLRNDMQGFYSFAHRSFAEFFAAKYLLDKLRSGNVEILGEPLSLETLNFLAELINNNRTEYLKYIWDILRTRPAKNENELNDKHIEVALYILVQCKENLSGANLCNITFPDGAGLNEAQLSRANCAGLKGTNLSLDGIDFSRATLKNCALIKCSFSKALLVQADFESADLSGSDFSSADLRNASFCRTTLKRIKLTPTDIWESRKREVLERIKVEQKRVKDIHNLSGLVRAIKSEISDKSQTRKSKLRPGSKKDKKARIEVFLKAVSTWKIDRKVDALREALILLEREVIDGFSLLAISQERIMGEIQKKLAEPNQTNISIEQKKRALRQKHRELGLAKEYLLRQILTLMQESQMFDELEKDPRLLEQLPEPEVKGAIFTDTIGLTQSQMEWLKQRGAIFRSYK